MIQSRLTAPVARLQAATARPLFSATVQAALPQFGVQATVNLAPSNPLLTAIDPFANPANPSDTLKPARPFWYSVDQTGLKILTLGTNQLLSTVPWPATIDVVQADGSYMKINAPVGGWEPVGITVTYPTEEALASNSETPPTFLYVVMAHSGYEWQSATVPPAGQDPNLRDTLVPSTNPATESSMLVQVDVSDPTFALAPPVIGGAILGHAAGQPAYDPGTAYVYVPNMPSLSLPTTPNVPVDLTSFVSLVGELAPPEVEAGGEAGGEVPPAPIILPLEAPDLLPNMPFAWPFIAEGGEGPFVWAFNNKPSWLTAHANKFTGQLDGILYGTVPASGSWTFQAQVTDLGAEPPVSSAWTDITMTVNPAAEEQLSGELPFEAGVPNAVAVQGTGSCTPAPTSSPGSIVPTWIETVMVPGGVNPSQPTEPVIGCVVMGTAPISGQHYEFTMPGFKFAYPWDREPVLLSGNVAGSLMFTPLPQGVGLSGLAWHEIDKIHDASTEADILNVEFFGVEPYTGQLYQILLPQGALEVGDVVGPPELSVDIDQVSAVGDPLATSLTLRSDIAAILAAHPTLKVKFGDLAVEANPNPNIFLTAGQISDPTGVDATVIPIGGPVGSEIPAGALIKASGTRDAIDPALVTLSGVSTVDLAGVQAYFLDLDSDLSPAVRDGSEPGQVDHGVLWVTGTNTGNIAAVDTAAGALSQTLTLTGATSLGGVSVNPATQNAYVAGKSLQSVTIFGPGGAPPPMAPHIWCAQGEDQVPCAAVLAAGFPGSFTLYATGSPTPALSYTGTLPRGVTFTGSGNGTASLAGTPADGTEGDYPLTIKAANGVLPDATAPLTLTVGTAPAITSANTATFTVGVAGSFTVTATGTPVPIMSYVGTLPAGVTFADNEDGTATLAGTPAAGTEGQYPLAITATIGAPPDATQAFILIVNGSGPTAPAITTPPANQTVTAGQTATFSVVATGTAPLSYQWRKNGVNISGATSASYTTPATTTADNGATFAVIVTNSVSSVTSNDATLTVNAAAVLPSITTQPANQTVTAGQTATFSVIATGTAPLSYQWRKGSIEISGATSASYTTPATTTADNGATFSVVVQNSAGSVTSNSALLTVNAGPVAPSITTQPANQTVTAGQTATFSVVATGTAPLSYQWRKNGVDISGATSASYTTPATTTADNGATFAVIVTNSVSSVTSNDASLTVNPQAASLTVVTTSLPSGTVGQTYSYQLEAQGGTAPYTWYMSGNGLPDGLTLSQTTGVISGTPSRVGNNRFTIMVTDSALHSATKTLSLRISRR